MSVATYRLSLPSGIFAHKPFKVLTLHDGGTETIGDQELDAYVRSDDYFIMLATLLETISQDLAHKDLPTATLLLDSIIRDLDYIQQHYTIIKRNNPRAANRTDLKN